MNSAPIRSMFGIEGYRTWQVPEFQARRGIREMGRQ